MRWRLAAATGLLLLGGCGSGTEPLRCPDVACLERTLSGHTQRVTAVAFSPDSRTLATGSVDFTVKVWNVADGALVRTLSGHGSSVMAVAFSPDGALLASGSEDTTVRLWRASDGPSCTLTGPAFGITALACRRRPLLLAASNDHTVAPGTSRGGAGAEPGGPRGAVLALALAPDGRLRDVGSILDGRVRLWSYPAASELCRPLRHRRLVAGLRARRARGSGHLRRREAPGPDQLAGAGDAGDGISSCPRWPIAVGGCSPPPRPPESGLRSRERKPPRPSRSRHTGTVYALAFSRDGLYLALGSDDTTARLWRVS